MIKKVLMASMLIHLNLWAGLIEDGIAQARKHNNVEALELFQKACSEEKTAQGCFFSGQAYAKGTIVEKDVSKAFSFFNESCDLGFTDGCMVMGSAYYYGREVKKDYAKAREIFSVACNQGDATGCFLLGSIYDLGQGVDRDKSKAKKVYSQACEYGSEMGCKYKNQMTQDGIK